MTRFRMVLFLACFFLSYSLVFASVTLSNERWALPRLAEGTCSFRPGNAQCSNYPERTLAQTRRIRGRENAIGIGGFYVDPDPDYNPPKGIILSSVYRTRNGGQREAGKPLEQAGRNYIDFPADTIWFRFVLIDNRGREEGTPDLSPDTPISIRFKMNYDLDY